MPIKVTRKLPSWEGQNPGNTAVLRCPIGLTYEQIIIGYAGVTLAQMNEIRVIGNGKTFMRFTSGTLLDLINRFHGRAAANGNLVIDFTRYGLRTRAGEELTALGTGAPPKDGRPELTTLTVEIDIDAAAAAPALVAKAVQSQSRNIGLIRHVKEFGYNPAAVGEFEISDIPRGPLFNTLHFVSTDVTALRVERDNFTAFERSRAENTLIQADGVRVPQAELFTLDYTENGNSLDLLETADARDLRFVLTMASAGSVPVVVESIAPLY